MSEKICPVCGLGQLEERSVARVIRESFGGSSTVSIKNYYCGICESDGDFFDENEKVIENEVEALKKNAIKNILNDFSRNNISMAAIERALRLPQRTLTKWKKGAIRPSASGMALMKLLRLFPWLLEVADHDFDYDEAQKTHLRNALNKFVSSLSFDKSEAFSVENNQPSGLILTIVNMQPEGPEDQKQVLQYVDQPETARANIWEKQPVSL
ncbi:MAG: hypothetical protein D3914_05195 [Candidatus Electrothrix sp. LOE2]|nr:hypothetical protein [Candidatus Electrothrix sp. LOE2]